MVDCLVLQISILVAKSCSEVSELRESDREHFAEENDLGVGELIDI